MVCHFGKVFRPASLGETSLTHKKGGKIRKAYSSTSSLGPNEVDVPVVRSEKTGNTYLDGCFTPGSFRYDSSETTSEASVEGTHTLVYTRILYPLSPGVKLGPDITEERPEESIFHTYVSEIGSLLDLVTNR